MQNSNSNAAIQVQQSTETKALKSNSHKAKSKIGGSTFKWQYRYVPEGQLEPDEHGRWAIDCYMFIHIEKALPKYKWLKEATGKAHIPIRVATMCQKGCRPDNVPSLVNRFCVTMPTFEDAGNIGFSTQRNYFSNDIDELKAIVEKEFEHLRTVFRYCR